MKWYMNKEKGWEKIRKILLCILMVAWGTSCLLALGSCSFLRPSIGFTLNDDRESYSVSWVSSSASVVEIPSEYNGKPVTGIASGAFTVQLFMSNYKNGMFLRELHIPSSITEIASDAFIDENKEHIAVGSVEKVFYGGTAEQWLRISFGSSPLTSETELYFSGILLEELTVPEGVTEIPARAFKSYRRLRKVQLSDTVTEIGASAFSGCGITSLTLPDSVRTVGASAFFGCTSLEKADLGRVEKIGSSVFAACTSLSEAELKNARISALPYGAFDNCYNLLSVVIPSTVTQIHEDAFTGCAKLVEVYNLSAVPYVGTQTVHTSLEEKSIIYANGDFVFSDGKTTDCLLSYYGDSTAVTLPASKSGKPYSVCEKAFYRNDGIVSLTIPDGVSAVGVSAFEGCIDLQSVCMGNDVETIGKQAFADCDNLQTVTLSNSLATLEERSFYDCTLLEDMDLPQSLDFIGAQAFYNCRTLKHVVVSPRVVSLGKYAFADCSALESAELSEGLREVGDYAFTHCVALKNITLPESVTDLGRFVFSGCTSLETVVLPQNIDSIPDYAFEECSALKNINFPRGLKYIGDFSFRRCRSLESVVLPEGVLRLSWRTFEECSALTYVFLPQSLTSLGYQGIAFSVCNQLETVAYGGTVEQWQNVSGREKLERYCDIVCTDGTISRNG